MGILQSILENLKLLCYEKKKLTKKDLDIDATKMVRDIRDKLYERYKKDPEAYYKSIKKNKPSTK